MVSLKQILLAASMVGSAVLGWQGHNYVVFQPHLKKDEQAVTRSQIAALRASEAMRTVEAKSSEIATQVRDALDNQKETVRVVTRETIKAIPLYLPSVPRPEAGAESTGEAGSGGGAGLTLPVGFGRLYDYTTLGIDPPVPAPSGEPLAAPSGISLPALAATHAEHSGVCLGDRAEVMAWREWYRREAALWPSQGQP